MQWQGDNTGPAPLADVQSNYAALRSTFPNASVNASTMDPFFAEASRPAIRSQLPVVTKDILDGWIYGVPSDPLKNALFREAARQRLGCIRYTIAPIFQQPCSCLVAVRTGFARTSPLRALRSLASGTAAATRPMK